VLMR